MAQRAIPGSETLAKQIRARRQELDLTIAEAAARAGVGTKTWSRYEAGEAIRRDKCRGVCRALNWHSLPEQEGEEDRETGASLRDYRSHGAWSPFLERTFGERAAMAFAVGSDILLDQIGEDMTELASRPAGTHIGQLDMSWVRGCLPEQFLTRYDYDFLYQMKSALQALRARAGRGESMEAHSVMEELLLYLCSEKAGPLVELSAADGAFNIDGIYAAEDWVFELTEDMDLVSYLYSGACLSPEHPYHFSHWNDRQFCTE